LIERVAWRMRLSTFPASGVESCQMLTRIYIDNYRCFVEFEFRPLAKQLIIGLNGAGKSTLLEVLMLLREFVVVGQKADDLFTAETRTRWQTMPRQTFKLEVAGNGGTYRYNLHVAPWGSPPRTRVVEETLQFDDKPVFHFETGEVHLYNDRHEHKVAYPFDWFRSALATISPGPENTKLTWFKEEWLAGLYCLRIDPRRMSARAEREDTHPANDLANFAAWYRHVAQEQSREISELQGSLREVIDGFDSLSLPATGQNTRILTAKFAARANGDGSSSKKRLLDISFDEMSDGQRALVALYTLLHCVVKRDSTICIDEPDNFVALSEIQPWLFGLNDRIDDEGGQVILVSHHPEIINVLAPDQGVTFVRTGFGRVRVEPYRPLQGSELPPSEQVARGWDSG
jgi:predicted ATPase